jgi:hypothetical protein
MTCWCCEKDRHNRFCRCSNIHCHQCHKCSIHCECAKSPTLDPEGAGKLDSPQQNS